MSLFSITSLGLFAVSIIFGVFVYSNNRNSSTSKAWFSFSVILGLWALGLFGVSSSDNEISAIKWQYLLDVSAPFIPAFYLIFISRFVFIKTKISQVLVLICAGVLAVFSFSPLFKIGVEPYMSYFWVQPGKFYFLLPTFFIIVLGYCFYLLLYAFKKGHGDKFTQSQIRYELVAATIGFAGGVTNFLPQLFNIYPFGNYFIILYVVFIGYAVIKHSMFNLKSVAAQLASIAIITIFIFNLFESTDVANFFTKFALLVASVLVSFFLIHSVENEIKEREKVEQLAGQLENFIHFLSHEVKGILGKNRMMFGAMMDGDYGEIAPKLQPMIKDSLRDTTNSVNMVMNILQSSDIKNGKIVMNKQPFDFRQAVVEVVDEFRPDVEKKGLQLEMDLDGVTKCTINGDKENIVKHVIKNLLSNSLTYTPSGKIIVGLKPGKEGSVRFFVKDTGLGLSEHTKAKLFTEGGKGEESSKINVHSTGYGLYFAKGIIEAHGGRIWAESDGDNKGSTFYVELRCV